MDSIWLTVVVFLITALIIIAMFTVHLWSKMLPSFKRMHSMCEYLKLESVNADGDLLPCFVKKKQYGDKVIVYHHFRVWADDFFALTVRRGLESLLIILLILFLAVLLLQSIIKFENPSENNFLGIIAVLVGGTDFFISILFIKEFLSLETQVSTYMKKLEGVDSDSNGK
jgi:hypothetical protein